MPTTRRNALLAVLVGIAGVSVCAAVVVAAKAPRTARKETNKKEVRVKPNRAKRQTEEKTMDDAAAPKGEQDLAELQKATFGGGCFWCTEAVFQQLKGVHKVVSGYSGGIIANPTYHQVCTGVTGHAEVIQVTFDPGEITYPELLEVFWQSHDPTTLNQQGHDVGTQYRSAIFYHSPEQKELAEHYKKKLDEEHAFRHPIVTEISEFEEFYPAEDYHQNYYNDHRGQDYCMAIIRPKLSKVKKVFHDKIKDRE